MFDTKISRVPEREPLRIREELERVRLRGRVAEEDGDARQIDANIGLLARMRDCESLRTRVPLPESCSISRVGVYYQ